MVAHGKPNAFLLQHGELEGAEFLAILLEYFNPGYSVVETEKQNIPADGRVVIVANHPPGGLDARLQQPEQQPQRRSPHSGIEAAGPAPASSHPV